LGGAFGETGNVVGRARRRSVGHEGNLQTLKREREEKRAVCVESRTERKRGKRFPGENDAAAKIFLIL